MIRKALRWLGFGVAALAVAAIGNVTLASLLKIDRAELGIGPVEKCTMAQVENVWGIYNGIPDYRHEVLSDRFGIYAAYATNAYADAILAAYGQETHDGRVFVLKPEVFGWARRGEQIRRPGGFHADVYHWNRGDRLSVMVVFEGTDGFDIPDIISNASYFTQMINPWDQYRTAREVFREVRTDARSAAGDLPVDYLAVGHSLGGGLARHMAASFPCVTAIAFNSSFVANDFRLKEPYVGPGTRALPDRGRVVDIFENRDLLSRLALLWDPTGFFKNDHQHQWYRINLANNLNGQHSIYATAAGMARLSFHCLERLDGCSLAKDGYGQDALRKVSRQSGDDLETRKLWCLGTPAIKAEERQKIVNECRPYFGQADASAASP